MTSESTKASWPSPSAQSARSIAVQSVRELGGASSLLVRQRRDHARLDQLLDELARSSGPEHEELLARAARLVFPHAYAEETVVWPALRALLPDGDQITRRNEQEHQQINHLWSQLEQLPVASQRRASILSELARLLVQDVRDEEDLLLPRLQQALGPRQLRRLGRLWELVRRTAPTRPHAVVSRRPPGNVLAALPLTMLDRTRDRFDAAARRSSGAVLPAAVFRGAGRALAGVAGGVENLPLLRVGEHPSTRVRRGPDDGSSVGEAAVP